MDDIRNIADPRLVCLQVRAFAPSHCNRMRHFYGTVKQHASISSTSMEHVLDEATAAKLSTHDYTYVAGQTTARFLTIDALREHTRAFCRERFKVTHVDGRYILYERVEEESPPFLILDVPSAFDKNKETLNMYHRYRSGLVVDVQQWHGLLRRLMDRMALKA